VTVKLSDGRTFQEHVEHATGTAERPMTDREIESKFCALCEPYLPASQIASLIELCWNITDVPRAENLVQLARVS
jgi:2-methylcitrate dehydratase PrpD